ncbi:MAG: hypothetical protein HPY58_00845 [Firmicutes bacterium]|nr:hypothetical protein [Bacillota bacterium]
MRRFRFRFQNFLNLKAQQEEIARLKLGRAQAEYQREAEILAGIQNELKELLERNREARRGLIELELLTLGEGYTQFQKEKKEQQALVVAEARCKLLQQQQEFLDLRKEKRILERLRERLWASYYEDFLREEQKHLDEAGTIRFLKA